MFTPNSKIALRTHISMNVGLGHYSRLVNLGSNLKNEMIWFISGDRKLIKKIYKKKFFYVDEKNNGEKKVLNYLLKNNINKIVMDLGFEKNIFSKKIYKIQEIYLKSKIKLISFDDARQKIMSDISIIPTVSSSKLVLKRAKKTKIFCGHEYNFFSNLRNKNNYTNNSKRKIRNILISISGTDTNNTGLKILKLLANEDYKFTIVSGKKIDFNSKKNIILKRNINKIRSFNFISKKDMFNQIREADLGICGPGVVKFDFSTFQKPFVLILSKKDLKNIQIQEFLKFNNCKTIIIEKKSFKSYKIEDILKYINNFKEQTINIKNSKKFFNRKKLFKKQKNLLKAISN